MNDPSALPRKLPLIFWALAVIAVATWAFVPGYTIGWDSHVYVNAMHSLRAGHDPYADGISVQQVYHNQSVHKPEDEIPYTYVYSPITLPILSLLGGLNLKLLGTVFWILYFAGLFVAVYVGMQFVEQEEQAVFALLAPAAMFFPGLLQNDVLFSGNIAYLLYGVLLLSALHGWRDGKWQAFYAAVLLSSCWKAHLLTLLVIPIMSARRQWLPASLTAIGGIVLFALQPLWWPTLFRNYLKAVDLQFRWNRDFGANPSGVLANALSARLNYHVVSVVGYVLLSVAVLSVVFSLRTKFLSGSFPITVWAPFLLVAVLLINPRVMEYDVAAMTVPMALVSWRFFRQRSPSFARTVLASSVFFAVINLFAPFAWKGFAPFVGQIVQSCVLLSVFVMGAWTLSRQRLVEQNCA